MNWSMLLRIFLIVGMFVLNNAQCPPSCFCLSGYVTCSRMTTFPSSLPEDTKSITFTDLNVEEIPAGLFDKLFALETIEVYSGNVDTINKGAFANLAYLDVISLNDLRIGTIASGAFSNITDVGEIAIYKSTIDKIEQDAFSDLFALDEIKISTSNISEIHSRAFSSIDELFEFTFHSNNVGTMGTYTFTNITNVYELSMYLNTFDQLGCGGIETLLDEAYEHSFYSNSITCSCDILWIQNSPSLHDHYFSNWCQTPESAENIFWADISPETLQCDMNEIQECSMAYAFDQLPDEVFNESKSEENTDFVEIIETAIKDSFDKPYGDIADFDITTVQSTHSDQTTSEYSLPTVLTLDIQDVNTTNITSIYARDNVIPESHMETEPLFEELSTVSYASKENALPTVSSATDFLPSLPYQTIESSVSSPENKTELRNPSISTSTESIPSTSSKSASTDPMPSTQYISTEISSKTATEPISTTSSISTTTPSSRTTNILSNKTHTASESQIPTKHSPTIQLEENNPIPSVIDVYISDGISKRKSNSAEASSYNEDVHGVALIADYSNSSKTFRLNIFLILSVVVTACFL